MKTMRYKRNSGFSLVELAIGLAVITVLILAVSMSSGIRDTARVQSAANSVQALRAAAENYLAGGKTSYTGISVDVLKTAKLLPTNFTNAKANPWGGDFTLAANSSSATRLDISLSALAQEDADKLTAYFNNSANSATYDTSNSTWVVTF